MGDLSGAEVLGDGAGLPRIECHRRALLNLFAEQWRVLAAEAREIHHRVVLVAGPAEFPRRERREGVTVHELKRGPDLRVIHLQQSPRWDATRAQVGEIPAESRHRLAIGGRVAFDDPSHARRADIAAKVIVRRVRRRFRAGNQNHAPLAAVGCVELVDGVRRRAAPGEEIEDEVVRSAADLQDAFNDRKESPNRR